MVHLLPSDASDLIDAERKLLGRLRALLLQLEPESDEDERVDALVEQLDELFLVVLVGEFNSGKSTVLNALFGEKLMEEGPIPTTTQITIVRHGEKKMTRQRTESIVERRFPSPVLQYVHIVDTPGTNSIIQKHQRLTEEFIPRADLVLFVTSYDRPLTESERQFLSYIRESWGKELVFIVNKADLARDEASLEQVIEHIKGGCREMMDFEPEVYPVSAELAFAAKTSNKESVGETLWERSRYAPLERLITQTLAGPQRLSRKLLSPLDTANAVLDRARRRLSQREKIVREDENVITALDEHLRHHEKELKEGYRRHLSEIDNLLYQLERRGLQFFEDTFRISRLELLRDRDRYKQEFSRQVLRDTNHQIESHITDAVDWLTEHALELWNSTLRRFAERVRAVGENRPVPDDDTYAYNRAEMVRRMMKEAERRTDIYDIEDESRRTLENARSTAYMMQYLEAGAAGLGALGIALIAATSLDIVGGLGLATAGGLSVAGFSLLPRRKRQASDALKREVAALREEVHESLSWQFDQEIKNLLKGVREATQPYRDLVRDERVLVEESGERLESIRGEVKKLRDRVNEMGRRSTATGAA